MMLRFARWPLLVFSSAIAVLLGSSAFCKELSRPLASWDQVIVETENGRTPLPHAGKKMKILFAGYVHCPDVCTPAAVNLNRAAMALGARAKDVEFLFISVDPDRDSVSSLKEFSERVGSNHVIYLRPVSGHEKLFQELGMLVRPGEAGSVDHSPFFFLISGDNRLLAAYPAMTSPAKLADEIRAHM